MNQQIDKLAALANKIAYSSANNKNYSEGAPHVKHFILLTLFKNLAGDCYSEALRYTSLPKVLDLGAGEGAATLPFLEMGADVTAIDISEDQSRLLQKKCAQHGNRLEIHCMEAVEAFQLMKDKQKYFDIIITDSFLHHIPDYIEFIRLAMSVMSPYGQFFSFQDPLRYDSLGRATRVFSTAAYFCWRIFQGDIIRGIERRIRRNRGIYLENSIEDNVEYHVVHNGVDQDAIQKLFEDLGFDCQVFKYFSTQSKFWQRIGSILGVKNSFAVIARRKG